MTESWYDIYRKHREIQARKALPIFIGAVLVIAVAFLWLAVELGNAGWENDLAICDHEAACMRSRGWHGNGPEWEKLK